ncbi:unnamed protein product [Lactuca saligna]|uniref:Tify domain-containing protein n=1 Tax=Lactuca saligna TaxID=75948 RepID=A0AA35ZL00_LACSI|nr:unnamed protein product [Lactuca saligna]
MKTASQRLASITIFHTGKVNVYDDIPADKARALLQLAASPLQFPHEDPVDGNMLQQPPNINLPILQIVKSTDNYRLNKEESNISREEISGLRNGMLLRFERPSVSTNSPMRSSMMTKDEYTHVCLQLISIRRIGITPAFLVPLNDLPDADIIALSDRPCLHLLEMVHRKRLNVQKFHLGGTPRKVLYHSESKLLLVLRTYLSDDSWSSNIYCVDPLSGLISSSFKLEPGETGKCMELLKAGSEQVLVVGTSLSTGPAIMPTGEVERPKHEI